MISEFDALYTKKIEIELQLTKFKIIKNLSTLLAKQGVK